MAPKSFRGKTGDARLGELLTGFFKFYSDFRFDDVISVRTGTASSVYGAGDASDWANKEFRIEEPFKRSNIARSF